MNLLLLGFSALQSANAEPREYQVNHNASELYVTVYKDNSTLMSGFAHNHAIMAKNWTSSIVWDPEDATACKISISLPVKDMVVDSDHAREQAAIREPNEEIKKGFLKGISESDRKKVRKNMLSKGQLNADTYSTITFESTSCTDSNISGSFTMRGKSNDISMPIRLKQAPNNDAWTLSIKGSFPVKATQYGFKPYSDLGGAVANQDKMIVHVKIRAK